MAGEDSKVSDHVKARRRHCRAKAHQQIFRCEHQRAASVLPSFLEFEEYVEHYHLERNHQALDNLLIDGTDQGAANSNSSAPLKCRERLGGTLRYYYRDAA
jgi:hypothetical protein